MTKSSIETSQSLFQTTMYSSQATGKWHPLMTDAIKDQPALSWNPAGVLSTISYGYPFGDTTLFREIQRQPWLSELGDDGSTREMPIPPHGLLGGSAKAVGKRLFELMCAEAESACQGRDKVYILLSGGLDSRIVAGVVHHLVKQGRIKSEINAVTWGVENCRDVFYGRCVAERLGYPWSHAKLDQAEYFRNIELCATSMAASVSPVHLHRMNWFEGIDRNSLVLAGSLGNMIGRGQITTRSMLEVLPLKPFNYMNVLTPEVAAAGLAGAQEEIQRLRKRAGSGLESYVYHEHEQAAHFSRGMLCQTMNIINQYCDVYQMLSSQEVYSFMWSRHPAVRTNQVYAEVLELVGNDVISVPWSSTNKAVRGSFEAPKVKLKKAHNEYRLWTHEYLNSERFNRSEFLNHMSSTNLFDMSVIENMLERYRSDSNAFPTEANQFAWLVGWLISLDKVIESLPGKTKPFRPEPTGCELQADSVAAPVSRTVRRFFANNAWIRTNVAKIRRKRATAAFLKKFPIENDPNLTEI